jgi:hypothetical protein
MNFTDTPTIAFKSLAAAVNRTIPQQPAGELLPVPVVVPPDPVTPPAPKPPVRTSCVLGGLPSKLPPKFVPGWYTLTITAMNANPQVFIPRAVVSISGINVGDVYPHPRHRTMNAGTHYFQPGNTVDIHSVDPGFVLQSAVLTPLPIAEGA